MEHNQIKRPDIHRDYSIPAPIQIRVYADRLKIWNPAHLPESWTIEKLREAHSSRPYNPSIANSFFRAGEIEAWGRGIQRIIEACRKGGAPDPVLDYTPGDLWVEFPFAPDYLKSIAVLAEPSVTLGNGLGNTRDRIMDELKKNPRISGKNLAEMLGVSTTAVEKTIRKLRESGAIKRVGGTQWQSYRDELSQFVL